MSSSRTSLFDLAIIGGGINGCGIARDAAGRGLSVLLLEQGDLASGTSSASTKLIHGGLRYLEHYAFRLVREVAGRARGAAARRAAHRPADALRAAASRRAAAAVADPARPVPVRPSGRARDPAGTRTLDLRADPAGAPLRPEFTRGFEYSDCWVDDARLVVLNARDAAARGADIRTRTRCVGARHADGVWHLTLDRRRPRQRRACW